MRHTTLRQAALGVIAILAVVLIVEVGGSAGDRPWQHSRKAAVRINS